MSKTAEPPTILVSANSLWNIVNFRARLIEAMTDAGYRVIVAAPPDGTAKTVDCAWLRHEPLRMSSDGLNPISDARLFLAYVSLMRRFRPAAYLSFTAKPNIYGALAARVLNIAAVPNVSGLGTAFIRGGSLQRLVSGLYRLAFRRAPLVFFQNREDRDLFVAGRLARKDQARILPGSGVDLARFQPLPQRQATGESAIFLFVGRLLGDKGVREFVDAARLVRTKYPLCRFQLLGFAGAANRTAITPAELSRWQSEGVVEYLGAAEDVRPYLAAADAVVLPSYREGLPRSLLEAAAMGRPLIASDVPGNREIVKPGVNGLLCDVRSAASLAEACEAFIRMPAEGRSRMGQESRRIVEERFSEQKVIDAYVEVLAELAGGNRISGGA